MYRLRCFRSLLGVASASYRNALALVVFAIMAGLFLSACDDPVGSDDPDDGVPEEENNGNGDDNTMSTRVAYNYYLRTDQYLDSQFYDPKEYEIERITVYIWVEDNISVELDTIRNQETEFTLHPPDGLSLTHEHGDSFSHDEPFSSYNDGDSLADNSYYNYRVFLPDGGLQYRYREESDKLILDRFSIKLDGETEDVAGTWILRRDGELVQELVLSNAPQATEDGGVVVPNPKLTLNENDHIVGIEVKFQSADSEREFTDTTDYSIFDMLESFDISLTQYSPERYTERASAQLPFQSSLQFDFPADSRWRINDDNDDQEGGFALQSLRMSARYSGYQYSFTIRP